MPLDGSHDATVVHHGTEGTADPSLYQLLCARENLFKSTENIICGGFKQKALIGERADPALRHEAQQVWHEQLHLSFGQPFDQYLKGLPVMLDVVPGLEGGRTPGRLRVLVPYMHAIVSEYPAVLPSLFPAPLSPPPPRPPSLFPHPLPAADWMASIASAARVKASCVLCGVSGAELASPQPTAVRFADIKEDLDVIWRSLYEARGRVAAALAAGDDDAAAPYQGMVAELEDALKHVGFTLDPPTPLWWQRSTAPPSVAVMLEMTFSVSLTATGTLGALHSVLMPRLAGAARCPDNAVSLRAGAAARTCELLLVVPADAPGGADEARVRASVAALCREAAAKGIIVGVNDAGIATFSPPRYGLVPWSINWMVYLERSPCDVLHFGPAGIVRAGRGGRAAAPRARGGGGGRGGGAGAPPPPPPPPPPLTPSPPHPLFCRRSSTCARASLRSWARSTSAPPRA